MHRIDPAPLTRSSPTRDRPTLSRKAASWNKPKLGQIKIIFRWDAILIGEEDIILRNIIKLSGK